MAATATPYGMIPVKRVDGLPYAGALRKYVIASGYNTNIFFGDVVALVAAGTVEKDTGTATATPIGIFMGTSYTDATQGFINRQMWPANQVASDALAFVCDDPTVLFKIQANGSMVQGTVGANFALVQNAGNTLNGNSANALAAGAGATTATLPLRMVDFWQGPESAVGDAFTDVLVKWNAGHQLGNTTGV